LKTLRNSSFISKKTKKQIDMYFETGNPDTFKDFDKLIMSNDELKKHYTGRP